jgi:putative ABC transport system ATP-binding protein
MMDSAATGLQPIARLVGAARLYRRGREEVHALEAIDLELFPGEWLALVGPSGCGKSTLLNLLSGIDTPDAGTVEVGGLELARSSESQRTLLRRRGIGIVFQSFHLVPHLTVEENVALPLALDRRRDPARVAALLERVGLSARASHFPSELSGGEQQRTALARALVHRPKLVLADEPTGNLDSASGARVLELLDELRRADGSALVIATHDGRLAARADRLVRLADGRIVFEGPPSADPGPGR